MPRYPLTEIIAQREFAFDAGGSVTKVTASVSRPARTPEGTYDDWYCSWLIEGPDRRREFCAVGVDGLQALLLALSALRTDLEVIGGKGKLTFEGGDDLAIKLI